MEQSPGGQSVLAPQSNIHYECVLDIFIAQKYYATGPVQNMARQYLWIDKKNDQWLEKIYIS